MRMMNKTRLLPILVFAAFAGLILVAFMGSAKSDSDPNPAKDTASAKAGHYGVSAGSPLAVSAGMKILENGGNAVDAAVAVAYTLGVVQPYGSGIGGGGAMLIYPSDGGAPVFYDYQGISPISGAVPKGYAAVPGFVLAMETINKDLGTLPMEQLIAPSIEYARSGFPIDATLDKILRLSKSKLQSGGASVFYNNGVLPGTGMILTQPELAKTLILIQKEGSPAFYQGILADHIVTAASGLDPADLSDYSISVGTPVSAAYGKYEIFSAPPPFGGVTLIQILKMAERLKIQDLSSNARDLYTMSHIINAAYSKRLQTIADPEFYEMDSQQMVSPDYIAQMVLDVDRNFSFTYASEEDTTHFVIIDQEGTMVSCTNSLSSWFGSGIITDGFFLNNHLKNFSLDPGNLNRWEAGKRPRTYMSPTIIAYEGKPVLGIGTPGGNRIPAILSQVLISILNNAVDPQMAIDAPRFYVRGNVLFSEETLSDTLVLALGNNGISTVHDPSSLNFGAVNCLYYDTKTNAVIGGADARRGGSWAAK